MNMVRQMFKCLLWMELIVPIIGEQKDEIDLSRDERPEFL